MINKPEPIRSKKIRESARGETCTLQIPGVCNGDPETTVFCHFPDETNGMGTKSCDLSGGYGCSSCHDLIDRRTHVRGFAPEEREFFMRRAQTRTMRRLIEKGVIKL